MRHTMRCLPDCDTEHWLGLARLGSRCAPELLQFRTAVIFAGALWVLIATPFALGFV